MKTARLFFVLLVLMSLAALGAAKYVDPNVAITGGTISGVAITTSTFGGLTSTQMLDSPKLTVIAGGSAGNLTLTGVAVGDKLGGVIYAAKSTYVQTLTDITSEFSGTGKGILATNVISNTGGTSTTGGYLIISWIDKTP